MKSKIYTEFYTRDIENLYVSCIKNLCEILEIGEEIFPLIKQYKRDDNLHDIRTHQILSLYKEMLERIDGILILMKSKSLLNAKIILRSFLEIDFDLRVILNDSSNISALNYMYSKYRDYILKLETYGKSPEEIQMEWKDLEKFTTEYSVKYPPNKWYDYSKEVEAKYRSETEKKYYNNLCMEVHGQNSVRDNILNKNKDFSLKLLRHPENASVISSLVIFLFYQIVSLILKQYVEDEKTVNQIIKKLNILYEKGEELNNIGLSLNIKEEFYHIS